jgi:hypothetical protein
MPFDVRRFLSEETSDKPPGQPNLDSGMKFQKYLASDTAVTSSVALSSYDA